MQTQWMGGMSNYVVFACDVASSVVVRCSDIEYRVLAFRCSHCLLSVASAGAGAAVCGMTLLVKR